jgi:Mor family transcriptional regulator
MTKPAGYWTIEKILEESQAIIDKGYRLSQKGLHKIKRDDLAVAIGRNGGFLKIKEILGIEEKVFPAKEIVTKYLDGNSTYKLAKEYDCSRTAIDNILKRENIAKRKYTKDLSLDKEKIIDAYSNEFKSADELAKEYNCAPGSIIYLLRKEGTKIRTGSEARLKERVFLPAKKISRLYQKGKSAIELSEEYACSPCTIYRILKEGNVKIRNLSEAQLAKAKTPLNEIINYYQNENNSISKAAKKYNLDYARVWHILKVKGLLKHWERQSQSLEHAVDLYIR